MPSAANADARVARLFQLAIGDRRALEEQRRPVGLRARRVET
jgi:hypothetical protein